MAGVKGRSGGWNRKEGPRWPSGGLIHKNHCECGREKTPHSPRCQACYNASRMKDGERYASGRLTYRSHCPCGQSMSRGSILCWSCTQRAHSQRRELRTCEHCSIQFSRKRCSYERDARRFCSRKCWGLWKRDFYARERAEREERRMQVEVPQERQRPCLECGQSMGSLNHSMHAHCRRLRNNRVRRDRGRELRGESTRARHPATFHVCPTCGETFTASVGDKRAVYCSLRCSARQPKRSMGALHRLPLDERNQLALMLADVKRVRRLLNDFGGAI